MVGPMGKAKLVALNAPSVLLMRYSNKLNSSSNCVSALTAAVVSSNAGFVLVPLNTPVPDKMLAKISWVDYSKHTPQNISFLPPESVIDEWRKDYSAMRESMFYGETESFDNLIKKLKGLNQRLNCFF